ncbi:hypothetical protein LOTGIDRAFT_236017 [Lottia gigantea]|uniref:EF-hand domain-containing protein n=1 Tax=Lottia gigantea TaxID=225164 RepID=V3ZVL0_LOTGI|nr:hypothetical protein LOTGIDRAFT_236017 [Lottia gigantea]ESO84966.1 hypothetical protein LOTGIDRAFT_236017 [Lottia gigantea]
MQTLEVNGTLGKIRAQLRANVFLALEEQDTVKNKSQLENKSLIQFLSTKEGKLVGGLVREFLEFFELDSTLAVFEPESGLGSDCPRRSALAKELNVIDNNDTSKAPLFLQVLKQKSGPNTNSSVESIKSSALYESDVTIPEELSAKQLADAKEKFEFYDKDGSNSIDKDELRDLFTDMFPNFHRNMLDRYVNDEFKALDKDFSNRTYFSLMPRGIDFEEFLGMYKRLFILCRSVVTGETTTTQEIKQTKTTTNNAFHSPLSSKSESISEKKDLSNGKLFTVKNTNKPDINDILGSDLDDDSFFDDPPPNDSGLKNFNSISKDKGSPKSTDKKDDILSLKDAPSLVNTKKPSSDSDSEKDKNLRSIDKRLKDLGLDNDDDIEYEDDFDASGHSLSQKSPRVSSRSDVKSYNENGSICEEIEEDIEDFSIEGEDLKSAMDDFTTDCSISQADRGFDYAEDLQLP